MAIPPHTIIVFEEGGVVQWVACNRIQDVIVISYDRKCEFEGDEYSIHHELAKPWELEGEIQEKLDEFMKENIG